ncbi:MAG: hypothetical protein WCT36_02040 [Candidatus Gracilibacteria bacterium]|jgi:D-alanine-D-alanine ligase
MNIGLTYNLLKDDLLPDEEPPSCRDEYDSPKTVLAIEQAIKAMGHSVYFIEADDKAYFALYRLKDTLDFVFNFAEGISGESRESQIPTMLEMLKIPYTACGPLAAAVTLDKAVAKKVLIASGISTPPYQVMNTYEDALDPSLSFPLIVKPNGEGSSMGVDADSVCKDEVSLRKKVKQLIDKYKEPVLVEKFLSGREFTIPLIGNGSDLRVLPILEIAFDRFPKMEFYIDCYEAKSVWCEKNDLEEAIVVDDKLEPDLKRRLQNIAMDSFNALGLRDFGRIDMRMDEEGNIYVLEANPIPGLNPNPKHFSYFQHSARSTGMSYNQIIEAILKTAFKRYGLDETRSHKKITKNEISAPLHRKV